MSVAKIQADYDQLLNSVQIADQCHDAINQQWQTTLNRFHDLQDGGWVGESAGAFFDEMNGLIQPAMDRLLTAFQQVSSTTAQIVEIFQGAEQSAKARFSRAPGAPSNAGLREMNGSASAVQNGSELGSFLNMGGAVGVWGVTTGVLGFFLKNNKAFGPVTSLVGNFVQGTADWVSGKENVFNAYGSALMSSGIDILLDAATGGGYGAVVTIGDLFNLAGQGETRAEAQLNNLLRGATDPRVQAILDQQLNHANQVFQNGRLSDTFGDVKNMIYDVAGRPLGDAMQDTVSHLMKGITTANADEFKQANSSINEILLIERNPIVGIPYAMLTDPQAQTRFSQDFQKLASDGLNLVQTPDALLEAPFRVGIGTFDASVNSLPISSEWKQQFHDADANLANLIGQIHPGSFLFPEFGLAADAAARLQAFLHF
ncbi:MAG: WXG100 family type VII secretion target [Aggregatilineales bacterium]